MWSGLLGISYSTFLNRIPRFMLTRWSLKPSRSTLWGLNGTQNSRSCFQIVLDARAESTAAGQEDHCPQPETIMLLVVPKDHESSWDSSCNLPIFNLHFLFHFPGGAPY